MAGLIFFGEPILKLLFPNQSNGAIVLQISAVSIIFIVLEQTISGVLQGLGKVIVPAIALTVGVVIKTNIKFNTYKNRSKRIYIRWN